MDGHYGFTMEQGQGICAGSEGGLPFACSIQVTRDTGAVPHYPRYRQHRRPWGITGKWLQVERELTTGIVVGIDLSYIPPIENVITITGDFTHTHTLEAVRPLMPFTSVVLSDASPKLSGQKTYDQARAIELGENALLFAQKILKPGGNFVVKSFQGQDFNTLIRLVREHFLSARTFRPHSTRKGSTEIYIVAKNFIGREWNNETLKYCTNETKGPV